MGGRGLRVRLRLSDASTLDLHPEVVARADLAVGSVVDAAQAAALHRDSSLAFARDRALALLARGAHTRQGLARKLLARGFSADAVRSAVERMLELGYLDDRAFARDWARDRLLVRQEGWKAVYRGLLRRGVPRRTAEEAATQACSPEAELQQARRLVDRLSPRAAAARLAARGFRAKTIAAVIRELRARRAGEE